MKIIPIKLPNKLASVPCYVSDEDFDILSGFKWNLQHRNYAEAWIKKGKRSILKKYRMHRKILYCPKGMEIDHKDGNGLNNQRDNLRICSHSKNMANQKINIKNTSGYKGVCFHKQSGKWRARLGFEGKRISIGLFADKKEAGRAYNKVALKYFGKFARLNEINI